ncbi:hypothetical protein K227x_58080 [Rubripirellula lacrimiformis]|uniref:Uncharacterized protein n=1 Tax=Rubripirellula lacrimiformis TaxID=1930273 RepID=A0A517NJS4_9BACT|nr:hypothetical protein K227x_58080 [Rubripirellula lacrimiformis]
MGLANNQESGTCVDQSIAGFARIWPKNFANRGISRQRCDRRTL